MNWEKAQEYGTEFVKDLHEFLMGDYSKENKELFVLAHGTVMSTGEWKGFKSFNQVSVEQLEVVLGLDEQDDSQRNDFSEAIEFTSRKFVNKPVPLIFCKEDDTDHLEYEDYSELIGIAESIGDVEWRNELLEREAAL